MGKQGVKKAERRRVVKRRKRILAVLALLLVLAVFGGIYYALYRYVHGGPDDVIAKNMFIGKTEVSGMKKDDAEKALAQQLGGYGKRKLTVEVGKEKEDILLSDLGIALKSGDKYIEEAVKYGKEGQLWSCFRKIRKLKKESKVISVDFVIDSKKAEKIFKERIVPLEKRAVNATIKRKDGRFQYTDEQEGQTVDVKKTIAAITDYLNGDWEFKDGVITAVQEIDKPTLTRKELETIQDVLGTFGTDAGYGDRSKNLKNGAALIDGTLVLPGDEVSAHDMTAPYTKENGYYQATAYENGQVVPSIGGGVCQVSTTLYNAAIKAELEITQRQPHSMLVDYVKPSRDAAIAGDYKDLKFKNNYDTPIYLESYISSDGVLTMTIYGRETRDPNREVIYTSETLKTISPSDGAKYVPSSSQPIGYMEQTTRSRNGVEARLIKTVKVDGKVVSEDVFNTSSYMASAGAVTVGTASDNANATQVMKNAIATQNKDKIAAAIAQAKGMSE